MPGSPGSFYTVAALPSSDGSPLLGAPQSDSFAGSGTSGSGDSVPFLVDSFIFERRNFSIFAGFVRRTISVSGCEGCMRHTGPESSSRKLVWVEEHGVVGWVVLNVLGSLISLTNSLANQWTK
jgi:hypothetical protein